MAAQELRWLTYLLTDLGEQPRSPPVLYVDNKAMLALCREHRLEHRTKHIALRYFLARELQQRGQLRLAYVASEANTADIFTKALAPGDHQRFCTLLDCVVFLLVPNILLVHSFLFLHTELPRPSSRYELPQPRAAARSCVRPREAAHSRAQPRMAASYCAAPLPRTCCSCASEKGGEGGGVCAWVTQLLPPLFAFSSLSLLLVHPWGEGECEGVAREIRQSQQPPLLSLSLPLSCCCGGEGKRGWWENSQASAAATCCYRGTSCCRPCRHLPLFLLSAAGACRCCRRAAAVLLHVAATEPAPQATCRPYTCYCFCLG
ncbi:unnamed protein product [Closterium sp. NIES-54]